MNDSKFTEGFLFPIDEEKIQKGQGTGEQEIPVPLTKHGIPDRRCKPIIRTPRPDLTLEEMKTYLSSLKEITTATGIHYIKLRMTQKMIIGTRESSGKEFTINLEELHKAYKNCLRFTSPEVKKYIFMGHSPAVALLRKLKDKNL